MFKMIKMHGLALFLALTVFGAQGWASDSEMQTEGQSEVQSDVDATSVFQEEFGAESAHQGQPRTIGKFRNTHYYVVLESLYLDKPVNTRLYGMHGEIIARVSTEFKRAVDIEGSGKLRDGRVVNFAGRINGEIRWHVTRHPYGHGVGNCALVPFHTVAVDGKRIPLGSVIEIEETKGMVLPDGSIHDGIWRAEDVGSAIQNDRIDLFVGEGDQKDLLAAHGITYLKPLTVRLVSPKPAKSCVDEKDAE